MSHYIAGRSRPGHRFSITCPNRPAAFHVWLRREHPELFDDAVALDEFLRHGINCLHGQAYLHPSARPLATAVTEPASEPVDHETMDCEAGVCFT